MQRKTLVLPKPAHQHPHNAQPWTRKPCSTPYYTWWVESK